MRGINVFPVADGAVIAAVAKHYPSIAQFKMQMRVAYRSYLATRCTGLIPIELSGAAISDLGLAFRSQAKSAKLDWIVNVRADHNFNYCPVCGGPGVATVDHHLPQRHFPEFSVYSYNLIPCCDACNSKRRDSNAPGVEWTLHPVFDAALLDEARIFVRIDAPWEAPFFAWDVVEGLSPQGEAKIRYHLAKSINDRAFGTWIRGQWTDLLNVRARFCETGAELKSELTREIEAQVQNSNAWSVGLLRGVVRVEGLCDWLVAEASRRD